MEKTEFNTTKHIIQTKLPENYPVPDNIPCVQHKYHTVLADPPWARNESNHKRGALAHYDLLSLERILAMPVSDLAAEDCHLWLWVPDTNLKLGFSVLDKWGFSYITVFTWVKLRMGLGYYLRNCTEHCLFAVRGKQPPKVRTQINWMIGYPTVHSEKPREIISIIERVSPGPYLELFCRKRPASTEKWDCWGNQCEGGSDIFIPGYPVPEYSFEKKKPEAFFATDLKRSLY